VIYLVEQKPSEGVPRMQRKTQQLFENKKEVIEVSAANLLADDDRKLWLSSKRNSNFPQTLIIDLSEATFPQISCGQRKGDLFFGAVGFRCWHAYTSNPESIKISLSSSDRRNFVPWQTFHLAQKAGTQVCTLRERVRAKSLKFIKLEILGTFSQSADSHPLQFKPTEQKHVFGAKQFAQQTYLNQIMLYRDQPAVRPVKSVFAAPQSDQLDALLFQPSDQTSAQRDLQLFGRRNSQQPSVMPSAISCNASQQPDLNLLIEDEGGLIFDTSFPCQFPTSQSN